MKMKFVSRLWRRPLSYWYEVDWRLGFEEARDLYYINAQDGVYSDRMLVTLRYLLSIFI